MKTKIITPSLITTALGAILGAVASWSVSRGIAPLWVVASALFGGGISLLLSQAIEGEVRLGWLGAPLAVLLSWYLQPTHPAWFPLWTVLPVLAWVLPIIVDINSKLWQRIATIAPYALIVMAWLAGGIPVWCLVSLLALPPALRREDTIESALVGTILFIIGYLITGIAR